MIWKICYKGKGKDSMKDLLKLFNIFQTVLQCLFIIFELVLVVFYLQV